MLYRLLFDPELQNQWFLSTPVDVSGDEWAFWRLLEGKELQGTDLEVWSAEVKQAGQELAWSFAGFDVPIVNEAVADLMSEHAPGDVQLPPIRIDGAGLGHRILVAVRKVVCVAEEASEFTRWAEQDGRPDKTGTYRMFTRLCLNETAVPQSVQIFRVAGWQQALIVREQLANLLNKRISRGLTFEAVA